MKIGFILKVVLIPSGNIDLEGPLESKGSTTLILQMRKLGLRGINEDFFVVVIYIMILCLQKPGKVRQRTEV